MHTPENEEPSALKIAWLLGLWVSSCALISAALFAVAAIVLAVFFAAPWSMDRKIVWRWEGSGLQIRGEEVLAGGATVGAYYEVFVRSLRLQDDKLLCRVSLPSYADCSDSAWAKVEDGEVVVRVICQSKERKEILLPVDGTQVRAILLPETF